ncbi:MAG: M48 family metallopeptidase [Planctomycetota bacterium]|nr:M48 family metallopeptidase [Planctomycetota bacterium]
MRPARLLTVFLLIGLLAGCATNPSTGRSQLLLFSAAEVNAMGEGAAPQVIAEFGGEVDSQPLRAYVDGVGRTLARHVEPDYRGLNWEFFVLDSEVVNAFALPGGKIFITRGLLERFDNEAQVAGVLGHEIGHVTARHVNERLSQTFITQGLVGIIDESTESELVVLGADVAASTIMLRYSRRDENEADRQGVKYMTAAGYNPRGMIEVLEVLESASGEGRPPEFLSTHPYPESRIRDMQSLLTDRYAYTQDNPEYRKHPGRFDREAAPYLQGGR